MTPETSTIAPPVVSYEELAREVDHLREQLDHTRQALTETRDRVDWLTGQIPNEDCSYSAALIRLREAGTRVARRAWGTNGWFIRLLASQEFILLPQYGAEGMMLPGTRRQPAYFVRGDRDGHYEAWAPTPSDQLTDDWYVLTR